MKFEGLEARTDEILVLSSACEQVVRRLVARQKSRGLGDGMIVCTPHELDGVTCGRSHCEWNVAQNSLSRSDNDRMRFSTVGFSTVGFSTVGLNLGLLGGGR